MVLFLNRILGKNRITNISETMQLRFLEHLQRNLQMGYSLLEALERIKWDRQLATIASLMIHALKRGQALDQAFQKANFHYTIIAYIYLAKESGEIIDNLTKCIQATKQRLQYRKQFRQTFRYPLLLIIIFIGVLYVVKQSILPIFASLFYQKEISGFLINILLIFTEWITPLFLLLMFSFWILYYFWKRYRDKLKMETQIKIMESIPMFRSFLKMRTSYQFATHVSTLLKTGMPMNQVIHYVANQDHLPFLSHYAKRMLNTLHEGKPLLALFFQLYFLDEQLIDIFKKSSDQDTLARDLTTFATIKSKELHRKMLRGLRMIQPVIFVLLGILIIALYLMLIWPLIQMVQQF